MQSIHQTCKLWSHWCIRQLCNHRQYTFTIIVFTHSPASWCPVIGHQLSISLSSMTSLVIALKIDAKCYYFPSVFLNRDSSAQERLESNFHLSIACATKLQDLEQCVGHTDHCLPITYFNGPIKLLTFRVASAVSPLTSTPSPRTWIQQWISTDYPEVSPMLSQWTLPSVFSGVAPEFPLRI